VLRPLYLSDPLVAPLHDLGADDVGHLALDRVVVDLSSG